MSGFDIDLTELLVGGAGAAGAGLAIAPAFSVDEGEADLWHVTRRRDADDIATQGLLRQSESPATKQAEEIHEEETGNDPLSQRRLGPTEQAEREFDELIADAKRAVDGTDKYPAHQPAVFLWPREYDAEQSRKSVNWGTSIVGVDSDAIPSSCKVAIGDTSPLDYIFKQLYDAFRGHGTYDESELYEKAKDWWRNDVEVYTGQNYHSHEVWAGCNIPPRALVFIKNPRTDRVLWNPTEKSQATLRDFEM